MKPNSVSNFASDRGRRLRTAQAAWREAACVVSLRWDAFLESEAPARSSVFSSYLAALDAEEAAAAEMARVVAAAARDRTAA